ncbi:hypothetical protein [Aestuariivirga sp.]|uniref:hypothetical protein n=1 Tax=Aestuariivirga sp. TaxID=2650926 RepID=UPI00359389A3
MFSIVTLSEDLLTKLRQEADILLSDRLMMRDVLEARSNELHHKRDEDLRRVEKWATQQKELINEVFAAIISETETDRQRNESNLSRMKSELETMSGATPPAPARRLHAAE